MLAPQRPAVTTPILNQELPGFFGEFGHGGNVEVRFIQSVVGHDFLSKIKLIEEISGSDRWNIKDLFQRNVDHDRVGQDILPYLRNQDRVKFIPPLTLVLLPMKEGDSVVSSLSTIDESEEEVGGFHYNTFGKDKYFKFYDSAEGYHQFSSVKWNDQKVNLVAVDGQHRLTAFKQWKQDPDQSDIEVLESMSIPVVILGFTKYSNDAESPDLLDVVRNTFVYINSKSQKINESRRILLDDESINCICTQEVVQYAHTNDQADFEDIDTHTLPLMMIDWRAEEKEGRPQPLPSSIFSVQDIHDWMHEFILGNPNSENDVKKKIIPRLSLDHETPSFNFSNFPLIHLDSDTARGRFKKHLLPAVVNVLESIDPYQNYISELRNLEKSSIDQADTVARHAFNWIKFGKSSAATLNRDAIENEYNRLCSRFGSLKEDNIPRLLTRDIGIRAIWSSFSFLKDELDNYKNKTHDWLEFSNWYIGLVNEVIEDGWFKSYEDLQDDAQASNILKFLTYIAYATSGNVINYKPSAVNNGLGSLVVMLILKKNQDQDLLEYIWEDGKKDSLSIPVKAGLKPMIKTDMNITFRGNQVEYKDELNKRMQKGLDEWIYNFEEYLGIGQ